MPPDSKNPNSQFAMHHQGKMWLLIPTSDDLMGRHIMVSGAGFTKVGIELLPIVDVEPIPEFTQQLRQFFKTQSYEMVPHQL